MQIHLGKPRRSGFPSSCLALAAIVSSTIAISINRAAHAAWSVISLHPPGATSSVANGTRSGKQVGRVDGNAVIWTGTPASVVSLGPNFAINTDGVEQVGSRASIAALWSGTAGSYINLSPAGYPNNIGSIATGVFAGIQCGHVFFVTTTFLVHAGIWTGDAGTWTDLNPPGEFTVSFAEGIHNGQQVGAVWFQGEPAAHATVWYNTAASVVDLNPAGAEESHGYGVYNGKQVGWVRLVGGSVRRASLWSSTAASWINLHPPLALSSEAYAVYVGQQAGIAEIGGESRASFWNGTSASWINLHSFLPPGYTSSAAQGIWTTGLGTTYVSGWALNTSTGQTEAMLWSNPNPTAPCPGNLNGDGSVNVEDLLAVISAWGPCPVPNNCPADIAPPGGDDIVNVSDLLAVIAAWGPCP